MRWRFGRVLMVVPALLILTGTLTACSSALITRDTGQITVSLYEFGGLTMINEELNCVRDGERWLCQPSEEGLRLEIREVKE